MREELEQRLLEYIEGHNTMTLATCGDNVPWAATVFYASDGLNLYFFSDPQSRHCQNLQSNSKVGVTIQEDYRDWRTIKGIQMGGEVVEVGTAFKKAAAMAVYARKYPEIIRFFIDPSSGAFYRAFLKIKTYCVKPTRVLYIDNEQGFGKRQELPIGQASETP